jgi:hypothetical protein
MRWLPPEPGETPDERRAREWERRTTGSRIRTFPYLGGWAVIFMPLDVFPYRGFARMFIGTFAGFKPGELLPLQARHHIDPDRHDRVYWAIAVTPKAIRRWRKTATAAQRKAFET